MRCCYASHCKPHAKKGYLRLLTSSLTDCVQQTSSMSYVGGTPSRLATSSSSSYASPASYGRVTGAMVYGAPATGASTSSPASTGRVTGAMMYGSPPATGASTYGSPATTYGATAASAAPSFSRASVAPTYQTPQSSYSPQSSYGSGQQGMPTAWVLEPLRYGGHMYFLDRATSMVYRCARWCLPQNGRSLILLD